MVGRLASVTQTRCWTPPRLFKVEFPDGLTEAIAAKNLIAENMLSQVNDKGRSYSVLSEIVDHWTTNGHAISKDDGFVEDRYGKRHVRLGFASQVVQEWFNNLGSTGRIERVEPGGGYGVCCCQQDCRGAGIC